MSRAPYPLLLMLAMALPGAARALGLGEIRVDSALNEPLSAQIDIVGATRDELMALTAKVASREVFQRYGAERPSFLASATFKVGLDAQGRPVLNIRSAQAFTDPVVSFLVELRWNRSELVREFSLLLDPSGFSPPSLSPSPSLAPSPSVTPAATLAPPSTSSPATPASNIRTAASAKSTTAHHRVAARDTLRSIARRAGARSEARAQRMMIAIFRANPQAFDGNINRLHRGVLLSIPTMQDLEATDAVASKREFRAQMTAWRLEGRPSSPQRMPVADDALKGRVQYLEHALDDMHRQLAQLAVRPTPAATPAPATPMRVEVMRAPERPAPVPAADTEGPATTVNSKMILGSMAAALALLLAGFALVRRRLVRPADAPAIEPHGEASNAAADSKAAGVQDVHVEAAALPRPVGIAQHDETTQNIEVDIEALERSYLDLGAASLAIDAAEGDTASHAMTAVEPQLQDTAVLDTDMLETVVIEPSPDLQSRAAGNSASDNAAAVDSTALDYDLLDLDATAQHVQMPSELHDHVVVRERRTSIVDVLKSAIDRDPHRSDLRMKLLETYYSVAATNQRAFVDVVKKLAGEREFLSAGDWQKVMMMGREIASDDLLFSDLSKDADLADCA